MIVLRCLSLAIFAIASSPIAMAAQQCLGLAPTARIRGALSGESSRSAKARVDRVRGTIALSPAVAITGTWANHEYLDTEGMPYQASERGALLTFEGPTGATQNHRVWGRHRIRTCRKSGLRAPSLRGRLTGGRAIRDPAACRGAHDSHLRHR